MPTGAGKSVKTERVRVADLKPNDGISFDFSPDDAARETLAESLALIELRKLRLHGTLRPIGKSDWALDATLGATVVQSCVVTLAPVVTRIDDPVERLFLAKMPDMAEDPEVEMDHDTSTEPLGEWIDLGAIAAEALLLALPLYPRAEGAVLPESQFSPPGVSPLTDEDMKPFAGLSALRDKLAKGE